MTLEIMKDTFLTKEPIYKMPTDGYTESKISLIMAEAWQHQAPVSLIKFVIN